MALLLCCSYVFLVFAGVFTSLSFALPDWLVVQKGESVQFLLGLWLTCLDDTCVSIFESQGKIIDSLGGWFHVVQISCSVGVFLMVIAVGVMVFNSCAGQRPMMRYAAISTLLSAVFYGIGLFVFLIESHTQHLVDPRVSSLVLGLSFHTGVLGVACSVITVIMMACYNKNQPTRQGYMPLN